MEIPAVTFGADYWDYSQLIVPSLGHVDSKDQKMIIRRLLGLLLVWVSFWGSADGNR